jgi:hypothetical protein
LATTAACSDLPPCASTAMPPCTPVSMLSCLHLVAQRVRVTELSVVVATVPPETSPAMRSHHW